MTVFSVQSVEPDKRCLVRAGSPIRALSVFLGRKSPEGVILASFQEKPFDSSTTQMSALTQTFLQKFFNKLRWVFSSNRTFPRVNFHPNLSLATHYSKVSSRLRVNFLNKGNFLSRTCHSTNLSTRVKSHLLVDNTFLQPAMLCRRYNLIVHNKPEALLLQAGHCRKKASNRLQLSIKGVLLLPITPRHHQPTPW